MTLITCLTFSTEIFLSLSILSQLLYNILIIKKPGFNYPLKNREILLQGSFVLVSLIVLILRLKIEFIFYNFTFVITTNVCILKLFFLSLSIFIFIAVWRAYCIEKLNFVEFFSFFLIACLAILLLFSANDLMILYILLEMQALCFYLMASFKRGSIFSTEAGLKYFLAGSFMSGLFLFGIALLYAVFGTLNLQSLKFLLFYTLTLDFGLFYIIVLIATALILIVFFFKLAAAPFHFWAPDVYEGSPLSSTMIFTIIPKLMLFKIFIQFLTIVTDVTGNSSFITLCVGIFSICFGILFASRQKRLKRFIIYSSISQIGFLLLALAIYNQDMYANIYFFLIVYLFTLSGFWILTTLCFNFFFKSLTFFILERRPLFITQLSNLGEFHLSWALVFLGLFFSFAGLPPLLGFLPKLLIFKVLITNQYYYLVIFLVIASCLIIWYYLNIIITFFFEIKKKSAGFIKKYNNGLVVFTEIYSSIDYLVIVFLIVNLIYFFFFPTHLYLVSELVSLTF